MNPLNENRRFLWNLFQTDQQHPWCRQAICFLDVFPLTGNLPVCIQNTAKSYPPSNPPDRQNHRIHPRGHTSNPPDRRNYCGIMIAAKSDCSPLISAQWLQHTLSAIRLIGKPPHLLPCFGKYVCLVIWTVVTDGVGLYGSIQFRVVTWIDEAAVGLIPGAFVGCF